MVNAIVIYSSYVFIGGVHTFKMTPWLHLVTRESRQFADWLLRMCAIPQPSGKFYGRGITYLCTSQHNPQMPSIDSTAHPWSQLRI